jgi:SAM-dependent methyltransferase
VKIELGGGSKPRGDGFMNLDQLPTADLQIDLAAVGMRAGGLPFADDSVSEVYSSHCLEHLPEFIGVLHELARVCRLGAPVEFRLPHWLHDCAMQGSASPLFCGHYHSYGPQFWWRLTLEPGCEQYWPGKKRLQLAATYYIPENTIDEARQLFPQMTDEQIMRLIPGTSHEVRWHFAVVTNEPAVRQ